MKKKFKLVQIVGARPQFIKAAAVSRALRAFRRNPSRPLSFAERLIHTGQHYDYQMSEVFFRSLSLPAPAYHLGIGSGAHGRQTGDMLTALETVLKKEKPDITLVYGDTNSTLAGALAAVKLHLPLAHVEAGLRSFDLTMPEEINRMVTDRVSRLLFCPTPTAVVNLKAEGVKQPLYPGEENRLPPLLQKQSQAVLVIGDVMYDAVLFFQALATRKSRILKTLALTKETPYAVATVHRAANADDPVRLKSILAALEEIAVDLPVILPLHPRTAKNLVQFKIKNRCVKIIPPVDYLDMINLATHARVVITDSGGLQKEAYFLGSPCLTLREKTEWPETLKGRANVLVGADAHRILSAYRKLPAVKMTPTVNAFGDGRASEHLLSFIASFLLG